MGTAYRNSPPSLADERGTYDGMSFEMRAPAALSFFSRKLCRFGRTDCVSVVLCVCAASADAGSMYEWVIR